MGSSSLIATSEDGVHHSAGNPDPAVKFRPRRFSRPRRFTPPPAFAGLFHPAATSRVCPSGVYPSRGAVPGFPGRIMPSCRWTPPPVTSDSVLAFRALLPARVRCRSRRVRPRPIRAPRGLQLLRVFSPRNLGMPSHSLRPRPSPRRTPRGWPPASCRCTDWLAWNQAADPLELSGLNPRPSFRKVGFEACFRRPTEPPDTQSNRARVVPVPAQRNHSELLGDSIDAPRMIWTRSCAPSGDCRGKLVVGL